MKSVLRNTALMFSCALVLLADISTSTSTFCFWYEPDCPKELLKE